MLRPESGSYISSGGRSENSVAVSSIHVSHVVRPPSVIRWRNPLVVEGNICLPW
jgi:hypothetical protein